ncbi:hypothetical protein [Pedobacter duraquae]|uniref:Lipoprotein n=1 Tax=Pedobacter duraquae TaxID=425511 RepID=A0A4R6ID08_9SPHI|nr:hypothetical protein [Pedobacter duraquae]TDO20160.1 hypothetical protein CLV32_3920 [Pedobacter duraquae]
MPIMSRKLLAIIFLFGILGCKKNVRSEVEVYTNDFESNKLEDIYNGQIEAFDGGHVLGRYNNQEFQLLLKDLPKHSMVEVSFDLNIHDSWDGNTTVENNIGGPDIWKLNIDKNNYITTTFSNGYCDVGVFCAPQSYPSNYLNSNNNPKAGASRTDLPGVCHDAGVIGGTTQYKITKTIKHSESTLLIQCMDELIQKNTEDKKCDESWSVDNVSVKVIDL